MESVTAYEQDASHLARASWAPEQIVLWVATDLTILLACVAIPLSILIVVRRRQDISNRRLVATIAGFVVLGGLVQAIGLATLWAPDQPLIAAVQFAAGLAALIVALILARSIPSLIHLPKSEKHDEVIAQLELALADVSRSRDDLERTVRLQSAELKNAQTQLARSGQETVQRSRNLIQLVSSLTRPGVEAKEYSEGFLRDLRGRINALAIATSTVLDQGSMSHAQLDRVIRRQVEPIFSKPEVQLRTSGPSLDVGVQGAQLLSFIAWELASRFAQMSRAKQERGRVTVNWAIARAQGEPDSLMLEWRETFEAGNTNPLEYIDLGDGTCTPELLSAFSERLLTQIVPHLLEGKGRVEIAPSNFIYRLTCPLSAVETTTLCEAEQPRPDEPPREQRLAAGG